MGLYVYKMFEKGLKCRGYQFKVGANECDHATCVKEGFHAAENPLDCLSYYPNFDGSECWLCFADGEVHENGSDSKISCTRLEILRRLSKPVFVAEAVNYILAHPRRPLSSVVAICDGKHRVQTTNSNGFVIAVGEEPRARAQRDGEVIALLVTSRSGHGYEKLIFLHGEEVKAGVTYRAWRDEEDECE
jgi:hypothetical protein